MTEQNAGGTTRPAFVLLEDGSWFAGVLHGSIHQALGEVVFTTSLTGYQETFTDPSYLGQIVVMTAPMIGNYGITLTDDESAHPQVRGVVVRELSAHYSNWQARSSLGDWLEAARVPILTGVDTRRLTRHLRECGAMRGMIVEGTAPTDSQLAELLTSPSMDGLDLASQATTPEVYSQGSGPLVVAIDYGLKRNIVRMLEATGFRVDVVPATTTAEAILARHPDGLFLSNGPGDPAAIDYARKTVRMLTDTGLPTFGICLGHQLLGLAYGGSTAKMRYGHRGGNHPVKDLTTGKVLITTQNHGFAVQGGPDGVTGAPDLEVTHLNLNDGTVEGLRHRTLPVFAVQYHPEAAPGPHDGYPHFDEFLSAVRARLGQNAATS